MHYKKGSWPKVLESYWLFNSFVLHMGNIGNVFAEQTTRRNKKNNLWLGQTLNKPWQSEMSATTKRKQKKTGYLAQKWNLEANHKYCHWDSHETSPHMRFSLHSICFARFGVISLQRFNIVYRQAGIYTQMGSNKKCFNCVSNVCQDIENVDRMTPNVLWISTRLLLLLWLLLAYNVFVHAFEMEM